MNRASLLDSIESHEGFRPHPYLDSLLLHTIGIGRCLDTNPLSSQETRHLLDNGHLTMELTLGGARWLMGREVDSIIKTLAAELTFWPGLSDTAQDVLCEMAYQLGAQKLLGFRQMLAYLSRHDYAGAAAEGLNSTWAKQTPKRAQELMARLARA